MVLVNKVGEGAVFVIWLILLVFLVGVGVDFFDLLVIFREKYGSKGQKEKGRPFISKIRNNWDYEP